MSPIRKLSTVLCALIFAGTASAQIFEKEENQPPPKSLFQMQGQQKISPKGLLEENIKEQITKIPVLDGPVDPREYIVGPGDIYNVSIWISPPINLQLPITPEGTVIIPTVGEVAVAGLRLDEAKKKVGAEVKKRYIASDVSFTLLTPRMLAIAVQGVVLNEGTVYLQATERVEGAVAFANTAEKLNPVVLPEDKRKRTSSNINQIPARDTLGSRRKIIVRHRDGTTAVADLERYSAQKDSRYNPYLNNGDLIIVPKRDLERDFIGVYGGVNRQGVVEFVAGDSLRLLLRIARDLTTFADSAHIEVTRSDDQGRITQTTIVNLSEIVSSQAPDIALQRGDRIVVPERTELRRDFKIYIEGEVIHPGFYPITRDSTMLSDGIRQAGGLNENALLESSQLFRIPPASSDLYADLLENQRGEHLQEDTTYIKIENAARMNRELVVADFVGLIADHDKSKDVYLHDGDRIVIASKKKTVYVFGQVTRPGHVGYARDKRYSYYVDQAGGLTDDAVRGEIRVLKAGSKQWLSPSETTIEEGDYLWVPKAPYRPFSYYLLNYSQLFSIVATAATVVLVITQLKK